MKKALAVVLIASIISAGCAHTTANPVMLAQPGDDTKSCDAITNEMQQMVQTRATAEQDRNNQIAGNVALGIAGAFLIVPWFFMDTGNAATVEERAAQARYQRLNQMQIDKKCPATPLQANVAVATDTKGANPQVASADVAAKKQDVQAQSANTAAVPAASKYLASAERFAKDNGCTGAAGTMNVRTATSETFAITCADSDPRVVRCDDGTACRELK